MAPRYTPSSNDVLSTLKAVAREHGGLSDAHAADFVKDLQRTNRYIAELWA